MQRISDQNLTRLSPIWRTEVSKIGQGLQNRAIGAKTQPRLNLAEESNFDPKSAAFLVYFILESDHFG